MSKDGAKIEILEIVGLEEEESHEARPTAAEQAAEEQARCEQEKELRMRARGLGRREGRDEGVRAVLRGLLPAFDDLERCVRERPDAAALDEGVRLALREAWNVFREYDLERVEGEGVPFDPHVHEAAIVTPTDRVPPGLVLETLRVGYRLAGDLVRPALVRVSGEEQA